MPMSKRERDLLLQLVDNVGQLQQNQETLQQNQEKLLLRVNQLTEIAVGESVQ